LEELKNICKGHFIKTVIRYKILLTVSQIYTNE